MDQICFQVKLRDGRWTPKECIASRSAAHEKQLMAEWRRQHGDRIRFLKGSKVLCGCSSNKGCRCRKGTSTARLDPAEVFTRLTGALAELIDLGSGATKDRIRNILSRLTEAIRAFRELAGGGDDLIADTGDRERLDDNLDELDDQHWAADEPQFNGGAKRAAEHARAILERHAASFHRPAFAPGTVGAALVSLATAVSAATTIQRQRDMQAQRTAAARQRRRVDFARSLFAGRWCGHYAGISH